MLSNSSTEQRNNHAENEVITLREENAKLQQKIMSKKVSDFNSQQVVEDLKHQIKFLRDELENKKTIIGILTKDNEELRKNEWKIVNTRSAIPNSKRNHKSQNDLVTKNRFNSLTIEEPRPEINLTECISNVSETINATAPSKVNRFIDQNPDRNLPSWEINRKHPIQNTKTINRSHSKKILVIGDSILRYVDRLRFNNNLRCGRAFIKSFPGATVAQLSHYIIPHIQSNTPDSVIIHVGTNDIAPRNRIHQSSLEIANGIMNIASLCKDFGVKQIFVSGITCRSVKAEMDKVMEVNGHVMNMCSKEGFYFISHNNIELINLWRDGIHLGDSGIDILEHNFYTSLERNLI